MSRNRQHRCVLVDGTTLGVVWEWTMGRGLLRALALVITLLAAAPSLVQSAPAGAGDPRMPDPCVTAPNLPFC